MAKQLECAHCYGAWEWDCNDVFDFNKSLGKRIWPAVCPVCRTEFERRYKSGEITKKELLAEFLTISGRTSLKCAEKVNFKELTRGFKPARRGKR